MEIICPRKKSFWREKREKREEGKWRGREEKQNAFLVIPFNSPAKLFSFSLNCSSEVVSLSLLPLLLFCCRCSCSYIWRNRKRGAKKRTTTKKKTYPFFCFFLLSLSQNLYH